MKKLLSTTPFIFMVVILAILLAYMCLPFARRTVPATGGEMDLGALDNYVYALDGQWHFYYDKLLTPENISGHQPDVIKVPSVWNKSGYPDSGAATYRLVIQAETNRSLALYIPKISSAYHLWVNGVFLRGLGEVSPFTANDLPLYGNDLIPIPINTENGVLDIILQVSNHDVFEGGISQSLLLGDYNALMSGFFRTRTLYCLALGCIFMMAFYHFTLYIFREKESVYLCFSLLCIVCFVRFVLETDGINDYFRMLTNEVFIRRFFAVIWVAHAYLIAYFTLILLESKLLKKWLIRRHVYLIIAIVPFLFLPFRSSLFTAAALLLFLVPALFNIVSVWASPKRKENPFMLMYLLSLILFLLIGSTSKILAHNFFMPGILTNMLLMLTQMILLSRNYARAFSFVEETNQNLERLVSERTKSLQATNAAMKELVSNISHDLKTPLAVLSLNLETLSGLAVTQSDADYQRHVRAAYQKNLDLQRLIQNLFEVSRIETGRNLYAPQWKSMLWLLAQAKEKYDIFLEDKGISLEITMGDDAQISIDPQKIWSVFDNIIYNAACYTESGGSITITARDMGAAASITVADTGHGIAAEHLPHIFERFYRGTPARGANEGESGLGLYIVKSVMEGCGGSVNAKSELGKGTSIILTFPARGGLSPAGAAD